MDQAEQDAAAAELGFAVERMTGNVQRANDLPLTRAYSDLMVALARWLEMKRVEVEAMTAKLAK